MIVIDSDEMSNSDHSVMFSGLKLRYCHHTIHELENVTDEYICAGVLFITSRSLCRPIGDQIDHERLLLQIFREW